MTADRPPGRVEVHKRLDTRLNLLIRHRYPNRRTYGMSDVPVNGLYVHPKTGLIREQQPWKRGR